jgi:SAM-dependent methyltransferase
MKWRGDRAASRERYRQKYNAAEADRYDSSVGKLEREDEAAYLADLGELFTFEAGMQVLDAGAGTGTLCKMLSRVDGLALTALEPAPAMLAKLEGKTELKGVRAVEGFCDSLDDRSLFEQGEFDVVISRQLANCFFDPLAAFSNWYHWLKPTGAVVLIDGLYGRSAWAGIWEEEVDILPLSACQTTAMIPYLLESVGFLIKAVAPLLQANERPSTRTTRYVTVAERPSST